jgi:hypothetical protein
VHYFYCSRKMDAAHATATGNFLKVAVLVCSHVEIQLCYVNSAGVRCSWSCRMAQSVVVGHSRRRRVPLGF